MGYCDIADVSALSPTRRYGPQTTPSIDQVLALIELRSGELDGILQDRGIAVPVDSTATASISWLRSACAYGAAMDAEAAAFPAGSDRDETPHVGYLRRRWERMLDDLSTGRVGLSDAPRVSATSASRAPLGPRRERSVDPVATSWFRTDQTEAGDW